MDIRRHTGLSLRFSPNDGGIRPAGVCGRGGGDEQKVTSPGEARDRVEQGAFSLIEITVAIGILAFAFVAIFALIPVGLGTFRRAMDVSVTSQISERIFSEAKTMTFGELTGKTRWDDVPTSAETYQLPAKDGGGGDPVRYFTDQGEEIISADPTAIYQVNTSVLIATPFLQNRTGTLIYNPDLATVTIQVAYNPGHLALTLDGNKLWKGPNDGGPKGVPIFTVSTCVARNFSKDSR